MGNIMILNGSPRASKSNSRRYAEYFAKYCKKASDYFVISKKNHVELCKKMEEFSDVLLVFPLYADALPVGLLNFLKSLENNPPARKPVISVLINCGFLEYEQNEVAVEMIRFFCRQNGYMIGSVMMLGSGEAILNTPFRPFATRMINRLAKSIETHKYKRLHVTMPLTKGLFIIAATIYWKRYGKRFGTSVEQMKCMYIEKEMGNNEGN